MGCCDLIMIHLRDFKMIIGMDILTQAEVSILPYLRTLTFLERWTSCTIMTMGEEHSIDAENLTKLESSIIHSGG